MNEVVEVSGFFLIEAFFICGLFLLIYLIFHVDMFAVVIKVMRWMFFYP